MVDSNDISSYNHTIRVSISQENRVKVCHRELQEREQRLQVAQSRVAHQEQQLQLYEEKLTGGCGIGT